MLSKPKHPNPSFCLHDFPNPQHSSSSFSFTASPIAAVNSATRRCRQTNRRSSLVTASILLYMTEFNSSDVYQNLLFVFRTLGYWQILASTDKPREPLKIMISGAPASGKGTQCQLITSKVSQFGKQFYCLLFTSYFNCFCLLPVLISFALSKLLFTW